MEEKRSRNGRVHSPPPHLKSKKKRGRGEVLKRDSGGGRAFTDDCSPVWAAKVQTWTSFISLQGQCPRREGSCHPALTSPQQASQLLKIPTKQSHGTLWKPSKTQRDQHRLRAESRTTGQRRAEASHGPRQVRKRPIFFPAFTVREAIMKFRTSRNVEGVHSRAKMDDWMEHMA